VRSAVAIIFFVSLPSHWKDENKAGSFTPEPFRSLDVSAGHPSVTPAYGHEVYGVPFYALYGIYSPEGPADVA
jgi:hypothetical protein